MALYRPCWYRGAKEALGVVQLLCSDTLHVRLCQLGPADEDITPSDVPADPPTVMQGPMIRARMCQLNLEVSLFLSDPFQNFENRLLPNDVILVRNIGEGCEELGERCGVREDQQGRPTEAGGQVQLDFESALAFRTSLQ